MIHQQSPPTVNKQVLYFIKQTLHLLDSIHSAHLVLVMIRQLEVILNTAPAISFDLAWDSNLKIYTKCHSFCVIVEENAARKCISAMSYVA